VFVLRAPLARRLAAVASGFVLTIVVAVGAFPSAAFAASAHPANSHADKSSTQPTSPTVAEESTASAQGRAAKAKATSARPASKGAAKRGTALPLTQPQPLSHADTKHVGANGQCPGGPYCSTRDGSPSGNGNGNGNATGKPCAGCVGNADNKNPKGQLPGGSDHNNGYECDGNHGVGRSNPAHTGCKTPVPPPPPECVPTSANNFCGQPPPPECVPTAANHFCGNPPPVCVPADEDDSCGNPPPSCLPAAGEDVNCVAVQGTKTGSTSGAGVGALAKTGADLGSLLVGGALLLSVGIVLLIGGSRRRSAR
jgi:hypothetical protein